MGSLDVDSLFPSLDAEDSANEVRETVLESELEVKITNEKELAILVRKVLSTEEIEEKGLKGIIPSKRKNKKGEKVKGIFQKKSSLK